MDSLSSADSARHQLPRSGEMLTIAGIGETLPVSESWPDFPWKAHKEDRATASGTFLPGPISRHRSAHLDDDGADVR